MKKYLFIILAILCLEGFSQTTYTYKGTTYKVEIGPKGGKYILTPTGKVYISSTVKPVVAGNTATYKGKQYPVQVGPKGGHYIIVESGTKIYIPKN
jgi:hypothetical protein